MLLRAAPTRAFAPAPEEGASVPPLAFPLVRSILWSRDDHDACPVRTTVSLAAILFPRAVHVPVDIQAALFRNPEVSHP